MFDKIALATDPTPPAAPVIKTGPFSGFNPCASSDITENIAVMPAVPTAIACFVEIPSGNPTSQSAFTLVFCEYPPQ